MFYFFFVFVNYFSEEIRFGISCESSAIDDSFEISSLIFSEKIQKKKKEKKKKEKNQNILCSSID